MKQPPFPSYQPEDVHHSPFIVFYEITRACDLVCRHCRACASPRAHPKELTTKESCRLLDQLAAFPKPPMVVLTGGDPFKRGDLHDLVAHGNAAGLNISLSPSATHLVTSDSLDRLQAAGISRLSISIDGAGPETHDEMRGVCGTFDRGIEIIRDCRRVGIPIQVNTTVTRANIAELKGIAAMLEDLDIAMWSVFFLVPTGRGNQLERIDPEQYEEVFEILYETNKTSPFAIKTTEAPFWRRFMLKHDVNPQQGGHRAPLGINDGKGVMFVSHVGKVYPSGFLPIDCGAFPEKSVVDIYQQAPLFKQLRDPDLLGGKCGACEYREVCGGSRARAYGVTGDPLAEEPDCTYQPESTEVLACSV